MRITIVITGIVTMFIAIPPFAASLDLECIETNSVNLISESAITGKAESGEESKVTIIGVGKKKALLIFDRPFVGGKANNQLQFIDGDATINYYMDLTFAPVFWTHVMKDKQHLLYSNKVYLFGSPLSLNLVYKCKEL